MDAVPGEPSEVTEQRASGDTPSPWVRTRWCPRFNSSGSLWPAGDAVPGQRVTGAGVNQPHRRLIREVWTCDWGFGFEATNFPGGFDSRPRDYAKQEWLWKLIPCLKRQLQTAFAAA